MKNRNRQWLRATLLLTLFSALQLTSLAEDVNPDDIEDTDGTDLMDLSLEERMPLELNYVEALGWSAPHA
jgi:hypothetical protein